MQESRALTEVFPSSKAHETKSVSLHQTMRMQTVSHRLSDENKGLIPADIKRFSFEFQLHIAVKHANQIVCQREKILYKVPKMMCTPKVTTGNLCNTL